MYSENSENKKKIKTARSRARSVRGASREHAAHTTAIRPFRPHRVYAPPSKEQALCNAF